MPKTGYYIYSNIPGVWNKWTLAVLAVSRKDANEYMNAMHKGGKFFGSVLDGGTVKADCGAVTPEASKIISERI